MPDITLGFVSKPNTVCPDFKAAIDSAEPT
jgi:hypothetical protein